MCLENLQGQRLHKPSGQLALMFVCIMKTLFLELSRGLSLTLVYTCFSNSQLHHCEKPQLRFLGNFLIGVGRLLLGHPKAMSSQVEQAQFPEPLFAEQVFLLHDHQNSLQFIKIFLALGGPELDTVLQVWSNERQIKVDHHFPQSAGCAPVNTVQGAHLLCCFLCSASCIHES